MSYTETVNMFFYLLAVLAELCYALSSALSRLNRKIYWGWYKKSCRIVDGTQRAAAFFQYPVFSP